MLWYNIIPLTIKTSSFGLLIHSTRAVSVEAEWHGSMSRTGSKSTRWTDFNIVLRRWTKWESWWSNTIVTIDICIHIDVVCIWLFGIFDSWPDLGRDISCYGDHHITVWNWCRQPLESLAVAMAMCWIACIWGVASRVCRVPAVHVGVGLGWQKSTLWEDGIVARMEDLFGHVQFNFGFAMYARKEFHLNHLLMWRWQSAWSSRQWSRITLKFWHAYLQL